MTVVLKLVVWGLLQKIISKNKIHLHIWNFSRRKLTGNLMLFLRQICSLKDMKPDIKLGNTLSDDQSKEKTFDYIITKPPYGVEWQPAKDVLEAEHEDLGSRIENETHNRRRPLWFRGCYYNEWFSIIYWGCW